MSDRAQHQTEIDALREQLAQIAARLAELERHDERPASAPRAAEAAAPRGTAVPAPEPAARNTVASEEVPEDVLTVIAAAVAAFLGERARVRQVRLISSPMWAQQGRVAIQASHRLER